MNSTSIDLISHQFEGRAVRASLNGSGEPLFVAKDVCDVLGIEKHRDALARVPEWATCRPVRVDVRSGNSVVQTREMAALREAGVYWLTLRSNKPEAERFQRWVCEEVLPALRREGAYRVVPTSLRGQREKLRLRLHACELRAQAKAQMIEANILGKYGRAERLRMKLAALDPRVEAQAMETRTIGTKMTTGRTIPRPEGWVTIPEFVRTRLPAGDSRIPGAEQRLGWAVRRANPVMGQDVELARGVTKNAARNVYRPGYLDVLWPEVLASYGLPAAAPASEGGAS